MKSTKAITIINNLSTIRIKDLRSRGSFKGNGKEFNIDLIDVSFNVNVNVKKEITHCTFEYKCGDELIKNKIPLVQNYGQWFFLNCETGKRFRNMYLYQNRLVDRSSLKNVRYLNQVQSKKRRKEASQIIKAKKNREKIQKSKGILFGGYCSWMPRRRTINNLISLATKRKF